MGSNCYATKPLQFILCYGVVVNERGYVNHLVYLPAICPELGLCVALTW